MRERSLIDVNELWFVCVIIHIIGSAVLSVMGTFPLGNLLYMTALWIWTYYMYRDRYAKYKVCLTVIFGWILSIFLICGMPISYQSSLLLNATALLIVLYLFWKRGGSFLQICSIKKIPLKQIIPIIVMTGVLIVISLYINGISMIFFQNYVSHSLAQVSENLLGGIIVFIIAPAIVEEIIFRGCIFGGIPNKKAAIVLSAFMFTLLHMNFNQMCYAFGMGILFAGVVYITGNVSVSILVHILFNSYTILTLCIPKTSLLYKILSVQIAGYQMFHPVFTDQNGRISWGVLAVGTGVICVAFCILAALFGLLKRIAATNEKMGSKAFGEPIQNEESRLAEQKKWTPDLRFFMGCVICILVSVLFEFAIT